VDALACGTDLLLLLLDLELEDDECLTRFFITFLPLLDEDEDLLLLLPGTLCLDFDAETEDLLLVRGIFFLGRDPADLDVAVE